MIVFAVILALVEVFVLSQLSFWGVVPLLMSVLLYAFRHEVRVWEALTAAAVYGFIVGLFLSPLDGLVQLIAVTVAAFFSLVVLRTIKESRLRSRLKGLDATICATIFTFTYWAVTLLPNIDALQMGRVVFFVAWSAALNLILMMSTDLVYKRVA